MTYLLDTLTPTPQLPNASEQYDYDKMVYDYLDMLSFVSNPAVTTNSDFRTLGSAGTTPVTQVDGDNAEISTGWNVFGAASATYSMTSVAYPTGAIAAGSPSLIQSASGYYEHVEISDFSGAPLYIYQKQLETARKYQTNFLSYGIWIYNNLSTTLKLKSEIFTYFDPASATQVESVIYIKPGLNKTTNKIQTQSLSGKTLGAGNYTEFRLSFIDLGGDTADINIYQIKCEFGKISTILV